MKLTFLGASQMVTGSCFLLETQNSKVLVDCGMFQGSRIVTALNRRPFAFNPGELDAVLLTHAHIDHSGLLPKLVADGYKGDIHATKVTYELCSILLPDSAHIQEMDAENATRKKKRAGRPPTEPIYTIEQAYEALTHFKGHNYDEEVNVTKDIKVKMKRAGHIIGSALVEVYVEEDGRTTKLLFSGDIGQPDQPIIRDPDLIDAADYVVLESTYGDEEHEKSDPVAELEKVVNEAVARGGNLIIPAFAVGRTQLLLYYLQELLHEKRIPSVPIVIDSPLATKATDIVLRNPQEYDEEATEIYKKQSNHLMNIPELRFTQSVEESRALNFTEGPMIIISASGMADAGRVLHHLKHNLWRPESSVLFVGFQAQGTMGRNLLEGASRVRIMGEEIKVQARIYNMSSLSAHADKVQIINWLKQMKEKPKGFFIVHGEIDAARAFSGELNRTLGANTYIPAYGDSAVIDETGWHIKQSETVSGAPAMQELRDYLAGIERRYVEHKLRMEHILEANPSRLADLKRRVDRIIKFIDNIFEDL